MDQKKDYVISAFLYAVLAFAIGTITFGLDFIICRFFRSYLSILVSFLLVAIFICVLRKKLLSYIQTAETILQNKLSSKMAQIILWIFGAFACISILNRIINGG